jgi:hypothetical protein
MSQPRVITSRIAIVMSTLVAHSTAIYVVGKEPPIFVGPLFFVLLAASAVCVGAWLLAEREYRIEVRRRAKDYKMGLMIDNWRLRDSDSGSWRRR